MSISLIANSGIQLHAIPVTINLVSDHTLFFHEWTEYGDKVEQQLELVTYLSQAKLYYRRSDLERLGMAEPSDGHLIVPEPMVQSEQTIEKLGEGDIQKNQELFKIDISHATAEMLPHLMNEWLPMPYYERIHDGKGPYNWCRMKLIPKKEIEDGDTSIEATILLAFDTHAEYRAMTEYDECPVFEVMSEKEKEFAMPNSPSLLFDYSISGQKWVSLGLMKKIHGTEDINAVPSNVQRRIFKYTYLATYIWLLDYLCKLSVMPSIVLKRDRGEAGINVDMVIDIGNSRTAAIFCEDYETDFSHTKPLCLQNWTHPITSDGQLNRTEESFDMRVAFQKVNFGDFVAGRQFVWPSMVRLGSEAQELTFKTSCIADGDEKYSTYSSPKRYLWDSEPRKEKEEWCQVRIERDSHADQPALPGISSYFNDDGSLNESGLGYGFHYSRRTLMTLAMMEIVAQTHVQINSYEYRLAKGHVDQGRYLRKIILTCPTGMSKKEQEALHNCLHDALFVLDRFFNEDVVCSDNYDVTPRQPEVDILPHLDAGEWMYDEATCSQFVYLYGLLTETYKNCSLDLFKAYGKVREEKSSLVVGSLDIGAGTSDIMIARYDAPADPESARLAPKPIFWDSFDIAGDDMLHDLISNVLIQGSDGQLELFLKNNDELHLSEDDVRGRLFRFFGRNQQDHTFFEKMMRRDFTLQVLVPLMYEFLRLHTLGEQERDVCFDSLFTDSHPSPSEKVLEYFKNSFGINIKEIVWHFDRSVMDRHIVCSPLGKVIKQVAELMCAYDCDVVLLSGRPTSLQPLEESFLRYAPRLTGKLVMLNKHDIGDWFPFINKEQRRINNTKSIVPVGAIIGYMASHGGLNGFSVDMTHLSKDLTPTTDYFIVNDATVSGRTPFIMKDERKGVLKVDSLPVRIGAQQFFIPRYPVRPFYVLSIDDDGIRRRIKQSRSDDTPLDSKTIEDLTAQQKRQITAQFPLQFSFSRPNLKDKEIISIEKVLTSTKEDLSPDDFSLTIQSLNDPDCYWLDSGVYEINSGIGR